MNLPKELTTVTPLSKFIALILFIAFPIVGFYLGTRYQQIKSISSEEIIVPTVATTVNNFESDKEDEIRLIKNFMGDSISYKKSYTSANYKCFESEFVPFNEKIGIIKKQLSESREIQSLCTVNLTKFIVTSVNRQPIKYDPNYKQELEVEIYDFYDGTNFSGDFLLNYDESEEEYFKLINWLSNGDIIFSLTNAKFTRSKIYKYNLETSSPDYHSLGPMLIEYCTYAISKGTSERKFSSCKQFSETKNSLYLKTEDLP